MIRLPHVLLPTAAHNRLNAWQREIDSLSNYAERVAEAKRRFDRRNRRNNATFRVIREALTQMCSGAQRCGYCEDSAADEVEHIKPKDLYPEAVFDWENYLYACGSCNGPKNNRFAVFSSITGELVEVSRRQGAPIIEPETGDPVCLNPRQENPLEFIRLDLLDTFLFLPVGDKASRTYQRAEHTIKILGLNTRAYLLRAREEAYRNYRARLVEYITRRDSGEDEVNLQDLIIAVRRMNHPTVWAEMKRQHALILELRELFEQAPEALNW